MAGFMKWLGGLLGGEEAAPAGPPASEAAAAPKAASAADQDPEEAATVLTQSPVAQRAQSAAADDGPTEMIDGPVVEIIEEESDVMAPVVPGVLTDDAWLHGALDRILGHLRPGLLSQLGQAEPNARTVMARLFSRLAQPAERWLDEAAPDETAGVLSLLSAVGDASGPSGGWGAVYDLDRARTLLVEFFRVRRGPQAAAEVIRQSARLKWSADGLADPESTPALELRVEGGPDGELVGRLDAVLAGLHEGLSADEDTDEVAVDRGRPPEADSDVVG